MNPNSLYTSILFLFLTSLSFGQGVFTKLHLSLNGEWKFADSTEYKTRKWNTLPVPGNWNTFTQYADYVGDGWYQRTVEIPEMWRGKRIYIKFDAVYDIADVWYNDIHLGQHTGGYTPFEFDITPWAVFGKPVDLTVKVNNEHVVGAWYQWGGISRNVHLIAKEDIRLIHQKIEPELDLTTGAARIKLIVKIENKSHQDERVTLLGTLKEFPNLGFHITGKAKGKDSTVFSETLTLTPGQTRPWHFDDPQLYHLKTTLIYKGDEIDQLEDRFGIRDINIKPDGLYLNGEKIRVMGFNRVHDHRAYGNTEPRHLVRADVDMMKRSGANFSRLMHAPSSTELLDYCDERGLLIWAEIPLWQTVYRIPMESEEDAAKATDRFPGTTIREMIERDWNHPCIVGWSPGNELRGEANDYVKAMRPFVKSLDPTRFYANIHDQGFQKGSKGGHIDLDSRNVDIILMNKYGDNENKIKSVLEQRSAVPELPIFYSEYGETRNESLNHTLDFNPLWERLGKEPYVIGGAHWTFNDYRSYFRGTPASQNRDWGLVDAWRNPKKLYFDMSKMHWPVNAMDVSISGRTALVKFVPRTKSEIPSFLLRGYSWLYELIDAEGKTIEGSMQSLQEIAPDDPAILKRIAWKTTKAKTLGVSLISNNGYTVAEISYELSNGKRIISPVLPQPKNPDVRKVLPLDGGFMIGVTSQAGDKGLEIEYGIKKKNYQKSLKALVLGAVRVRGLNNGQKYYGRVRRLENHGPGPWSEEFEVIPDGGQPPKSPKVRGFLKGENTDAIKLDQQEKIEGYEIELSSGEKKEIQVVHPGWLIVPKKTISISTINRYGKSKKTELGQ